MLPQIKTVLYCTAHTSKSAAIFRSAYGFAKQLNARIVVLHVLESLTDRQKAFVEGYSGVGTLTPLIEEAETRASQSLPERIEAFCADTVPDDDWRDIVSEIIVARGHVADQILAHVASTGADLVVLGSHGPATLPERLTGSTAHRMLRECPVPVLAVRFVE